MEHEETQERQPIPYYKLKSWQKRFEAANGTIHTALIIDRQFCLGFEECLRELYRIAELGERQIEGTANPPITVGNPPINPYRLFTTCRMCKQLALKGVQTILLLCSEEATTQKSLDLQEEIKQILVKIHARLDEDITMDLQISPQGEKEGFV